MVAVAQARDLLARHHGGGGAVPARDNGHMARGRWAQDGDGWSHRRGRSGSRGGGRWGNSGRRGEENSADADKLRKENQKLLQQLREAKRGGGGDGSAAKSRPGPQENVPRPSAREGPDREGDWWCANCLFRTNRHGRDACYRCAVSRSFSMSTPCSAGTSPGINVHRHQGHHQGTTPTTTSTQAGLAAASSSPSTQTQQPIAGPEAAKAIRQRITALEAARAALAGCTGCEADREHINQQLNAAKHSLAAHLPVEVAVKGTLGTASQARVAVTKAEAKVSRLETQLTSIVEQYENALAELSASRARLAEAEAATARAASVALPPEHYLAAVAADPGPFWSAFKSIILQRCPGLPAESIGQLDNVTKAFEAIVGPIFQPAGAAGGTTVAAQGTSADMQAAATANLQSERAPAAQHPADNSLPTATMPTAPTSADDAIGLLHLQLAAQQPVQPGPSQEQQQHQQQHQHQHQQQQPPQPECQPAFASAAAAESARALLVATAAAAAAPVITSLDGGADVGDGHVLGASGGGHVVSEPANDPMGGGAADGISNKRPIAEVAATARAIAARAKAKAAA